MVGELVEGRFDGCADGCPVGKKDGRGDGFRVGFEGEAVPTPRAGTVSSVENVGVLVGLVKCFVGSSVGLLVGTDVSVGALEGREVGSCIE